MFNTGTSEEAIAETEREMGVIFPEGLKLVWRKANGFELPGGWRFFPVFDPKEARKTGNHIGYENTKGRWPHMDKSLVSIAGTNTGNQLVLKNIDNVLEETIYIWNHDSNHIHEWSQDLGHLLAQAELRITTIVNKR